MANSPLSGLTRRSALLSTDLIPIGIAGDPNLYQGSIAQVVAVSAATPVNEWIDPQFCLQDQNAMLSAINDAGTAVVPPLSVSSFTTGALTTVCSCADTSTIYLGSLGYFAGAGLDAVLAASDNGERRVFRVTAIVDNVSFTIISEKYWGAPAASTACMFQPVMRGVSSGAAGNITSNAAFFGTGNIWISDRPAHVAKFNGAARVLVFQVTGVNSSLAFQPNKPLAYYRNQNRAVGMAVYVLSGGGSAQAYINNGGVVQAGAIATANARTWIGTQMNLGPATYYSVGVTMTGVGFYMVGEVTEASSTVVMPDGSFSTPLWGCARALASISPWIGLTVNCTNAVPFTVDMMQASHGVLQPGISYFWAQLEGQGSNIGNTFGSYAVPSGAIYNIGLQCLNTSFYSYQSSNFHVDSNCRLIFIPYGAATFAWTLLSWDISMVFIGSPN